MSTDDFSDAELELLITACAVAAARIGQLCKASGYPQPTAEQTEEMSRLVREAFTLTVAGLRATGPEEMTTEELGEGLYAAAEGVAQGAILRVMGSPPSTSGDHN